MALNPDLFNGLVLGMAAKGRLVLANNIIDSFTFNDNGTVTMIDSDAAPHTLEFTKDSTGMITGAMYDNVVIPITFTGDLLTKVGFTDIVGIDSYVNG